MCISKKITSLILGLCISSPLFLSLSLSSPPITFYAHIKTHTSCQWKKMSIQTFCQINTYEEEEKTLYVCKKRIEWWARERKTKNELVSEHQDVHPSLDDFLFYTSSLPLLLSLQLNTPSYTHEYEYFSTCTSYFEVRDAIGTGLFLYHNHHHHRRRLSACLAGSKIWIFISLRCRL